MPQSLSTSAETSNAPVPPPSSSSKGTLWIMLVGFVALVVALIIWRGPSSAFFSIITLLEVVALFNILIIVHELGHFLAAKWCGLKIEKFAIWFGKPLWSKNVDGVEYILGSIPGGGYVALPQMAPMEALEGKSDIPKEELPAASPWQKIIVAFAGPLFSFGLALFFACIVWNVGKPVRFSESTTVIGFTQPDYPAAKAGIQPGDKIISIDGHPIRRFFGMGDSVIWSIMTSTADTIPVVVERNGQVLPAFNVEPVRDAEHEHQWYQRAPTRKIGIGPAQKEIVLKKLIANSPALVGGLREGDKLTAMNGQPIYSTALIGLQLKDHPTDPIKFDVLRDGAPLVVTITPEKPISPAVLPKDGPQTDIGIDELKDENVDLVYPNPWQQVRESVDAVTGTLTALFTPKSTVGASQLSGPIGIMNIFFAVLSSDNGWRLALWIAVLINVNLALLNLFPLPVLDGGHIALSIIEWIRRRPLSMGLLEPLQTACALVLICYMAYITFFDVQDSGRMALSGGGASTEIKFAPKSPAQ